MVESILQRVILIHYHEIGLKGKNRASFEMKLLQNVEKLLKKSDIFGFQIRRISGRLCVLFKQDVDMATINASFNLIAKIPGIARVSDGLKCEQTLESIIKAGIKVMNEAGGNCIESFKVNARRNHTSFETNSMEINQIVGGALSDAYPQVKVQMKYPELEVHVEVIQGDAYVYGKTISGVGGLPVGSSGKVVALLSSGIDSPVALWQIARRGAVCIGVHFSGAPIVSNESEYLVNEIGDILSESGCISKIYIVRIGKYQKKIAEEAPSKLRIILYRRLMYKIAEEVAKREGAGALITGESLGQVASQTLENLGVTDAAVSLPVFRPLVGTDKVEIIDRAQQIGTFDISSEQTPDCCTLYMPKNPETHAQLKYVEYVEQVYPYNEWIPKILEHTTIKTYK